MQLSAILFVCVCHHQHHNIGHQHKKQWDTVITRLATVVVVVVVRQKNSLIQMESLLLGRGEQPFAQDFLVRIVRQLQIVDTGIDGRVRTLAGVHLPDHG